MGNVCLLSWTSAQSPPLNVWATFALLSTVLQKHTSFQSDVEKTQDSQQRVTCLEVLAPRGANVAWASVLWESL